MKQATETNRSIGKRKNPINIFCIFCMTMFLLITQIPVQAQENQNEPNDPFAKLRENTDYYMAIYFDYKPGKANEAFKLIEKYFIPVDEEAERYVIQFRPMTGTWEEIAFFPLEIGPKALAYSLSPSDAMWNAAFVKQVGSQKRVNEIWEKFQSLVVKTKSVLVTRSHGL